MSAGRGGGGGRAGLVGLIAGVLGALSAVALLGWPPQVEPGVVSYPLTSRGFRVVQGWFFVHHFGLSFALAALAVSPAVGSRRIVRGAAWLAVAGMVLLSFVELLAMRYADWDDTAANEGLMGSAYGVAVTWVGLAMLVVGVGVLRARVWAGWHRWVPLAIGVAVFVVVTPGMFGGFVIGRLAIGFWMLMFAALGWSLYVTSRAAGAAGASAGSAGAAAQRAGESVR